MVDGGKGACYRRDRENILLAVDIFSIFVIGSNHPLAPSFLKRGFYTFLSGRIAYFTLLDSKRKQGTLQQGGGGGKSFWDVVKLWVTYFRRNLF